MAAAARDVQAKGRLQPWNSKGCRPEGVVAAASNALTREGYVQAGCNAGTLTARGGLEPLLWPCGGFCVREWRVLGLLGYLFLAELAGLLEGLEGFGAFEAWQTAALNAYKKPLLRPWGALEPLLWPCGGFCVRQWRVLGLLGNKRGLSAGKGQAAMLER